MFHSLLLMLLFIQQSFAYIVPLTESAQKGAKCLDGSIPVYYFRDGTGSNKHKFLIWFEGGAWCHSNNGEISIAHGLDSCYKRSLTSLGSKNKTEWIPNIININFKGKGYLTDNKQLNPMMYNWNTAILRYCDGSSYSSDLSEPIIITNNNGKQIKLYHRGYQILQSFIKHLYYNKGLNMSTDIIIAGESAGGLSVYLHIDNINNLIHHFDKTNNIQHDFKIVGLIDSGIFPETGTYTHAMKWIYNTLNISASINEDCIKMEGYKCMYGLNIIKYIQIPLFIVGSVMDRWQIDNQVFDFNIDKIIQHSVDLENNIKTLFNKNVSNRNGLWLFGCYSHTGCFNQVQINDRKLLHVFSDWYNGINDKYKYKYISEYEDYLCMECEKLQMIVNNLCVGFNQYPID
eukprot:333627_1